MGYGSKYDMYNIEILVCDDCVDAKGLHCDWMEKLGKHWENDNGG
jgi:hypothetical protein